MASTTEAPIPPGAIDTSSAADLGTAGVASVVPEMRQSVMGLDHFWNVSYEHLACVDVKTLVYKVIHNATGELYYGRRTDDVPEIDQLVAGADSAYSETLPLLLGYACPGEYSKCKRHTAALQ